MTRSHKETAVVTLLLLAVATVVYGRHVLDGGFLADAWTNRSVYVFSPEAGFFGSLNEFLVGPNMAARPLYAVYLVVLNAAFGSHTDLWLAWLGVTNVFMSLSIYLLLRKLHFQLIEAALIACLILIFPASSSLRFWAATVQIPVALSFASLGFLVALNAFDAGGRKRLLLHAVSLAMFVTSVLFYEAAMPLMLCSVLLYRLQVPWSLALRRWIVDLVVLVSVTAVVASSASGAKEVQGLSGMWHHATTIFDQSWTLFATVVLPLGAAGWWVLGLAGLISLAAVLVVRRLPSDDLARGHLLHWLGVLGGGLLVVALGYSVFVPGAKFYLPLAEGVGDRVNGVPSIGWVLVLYAAVMLALTLGARALRISSKLILPSAVVVCLLISVGWLNSVSRDADAYIAAHREGQRVLASIRDALPKPSPGTMIWTFGQPVAIAPGVPVFSNTWDMTSGVQLLYGTSSIKSLVALPDTTFECRGNRIVPGGSSIYPQTIPRWANQFASRYGLTYFVDTTDGRRQLIRTPQDCRAASRSFGRSPFYPWDARPLAPAPLTPAPKYRLGAKGDNLLSPSGQPISVRRDAITGYVDYVAIEGDTVSLSGWAVASNPALPAQRVLGMFGGREIASAEVDGIRPDVVRITGKPALRASGFVMTLKRPSADCRTAAAKLKLFGIFDEVATPLAFAGDSKEQLEAAC